MSEERARALEEASAERRRREDLERRMMMMEAQLAQATTGPVRRSKADRPAGPEEGINALKSVLKEFPALEEGFQRIQSPGLKWQVAMMRTQTMSNMFETGVGFLGALAPGVVGIFSKQAAKEVEENLSRFNEARAAAAAAADEVEG